MNEIMKLSYTHDGEFAFAIQCPKDIDKYRGWVMGAIVEGDASGAEYWTKALIDLTRRYAMFQVRLLARINPMNEA